MSAVIKLCAAVVQQQVGRDDAEAEGWRVLAFVARDEIDQLRRAEDAERAYREQRLINVVTTLEQKRTEARAALYRIAVLMQCEPDNDDDLAEAVRLLVSERDKLRAERRQLRTRLVECLPFVGVCPLEPNRIQLMRLVRDLADDTLEEVKP